MKNITLEKAEVFDKNEICKTIEYSFQDKDLDLGIAIIKGRYPEKGYCMNEISKELIYILEGTGKIITNKKEISFKEGDAIFINPKEKYYWDTTYCKASMSCTPAWSPNQYKVVEE